MTQSRNKREGRYAGTNWYLSGTTGKHCRSHWTIYQLKNRKGREKLSWD